MKPFQAILLGVFGFFAIIGVIAFATFRSSNDGPGSVPVTMWGTISREIIFNAIDGYNREVDNDAKLAILYKEFSEDSFNSDLVEAIAENRGPDIILLQQDSITQQDAKVLTVPFESYPERLFKDTFIELGELYVNENGVLGLPLLIDPMVLYWNRDLFATAGIPLPPKTWEELVDVSDRLTKRDEVNNILRSSIALGEFQNIEHAKEILALLILQAGDPIITQGITEELSVTFGTRQGYAEVPAEAALRFYTEFANPVKTLYSWNRSLPSSRTAFLAGDVAMYLGFASELVELSAQNPNLDFDVTLVPQIKGIDINKTFGVMHALALLRSSNKADVAFRAMSIMTGRTFLTELANATVLPPVRRDMLQKNPQTAEGGTFYQSALIADAFLDPDDIETEAVFRRMVEDVTSGRENISAAVSRARNSLTALLP